MRASTFVLPLSLLCACYDQPDSPQSSDTDADSSGGSSGTSPTSGNTTPGTTEPTTTSSMTTSMSTSEPTTTSPTTTQADSSDGSSSADTGETTTGPEPACGDGNADAGEICLPDMGEVFNVGIGAFDVAIADIDGVGLDIITLNRMASTVSVLRNDGTGGFGNAESHTVGDGSCRIQAVDGDADGHVDLVISGDPIVTLVNDGSGDFDRNDAPFSAGGFGGCSEVHGLDTLQNGGGPIDIVYSGEYNNTFAVGIDPVGGWTFGMSTSSIDPAGEGSAGVTVTHLGWDGDAFPDVIVLNKYSDNGSIWRGDGAGDFTAASTYSPCSMIESSGSAHAAAGDLDSDGEIDIVTTCVTGFQEPVNQFSISLGNGDGTYDPPTALDTNGAIRPLIADLNGDDYPDVLVASTIDFGVNVFINDGAGTFGDPIALIVGEPVWSMNTGDLNDDGAVDVVIPYDTPMGGRVAVFFAEP